MSRYDFLFHKALYNFADRMEFDVLEELDEKDRVEYMCEHKKIHGYCSVCGDECDDDCPAYGITCDDE